MKQTKFILICENCQKKFPSESGYYTCPFCNGRLKIIYKEANKFVENYPKIFSGMWKYYCYLPIEKGNLISLGEGDTPLLNANNNYSDVSLWI